jgi:hypothetical protein
MRAYYISEELGNINLFLKKLLAQDKLPSPAQLSERRLSFFDVQCPVISKFPNHSPLHFHVSNCKENFE